MTDVILGIDFQREYRISYDWDEEKWCYIRYKGQFLCYTEDMESGINRVSIAKTIHIPPKHNGAISVSIKAHNIKTPTACFNGSQYMDTEVRLIDGVHDISCERSRNLDRSFRNIYIIPSFPTREQHAHSVQNARSRFTKLNQ